jgi:hypothetical protein
MIAVSATGMKARRIRTIHRIAGDDNNRVLYIGFVEVRFITSVDAHGPHEGQTMVEIHCLSFGTGGIRVNQNQFAGDTALDQRIGKRGANHPCSNQAYFIVTPDYIHDLDSFLVLLRLLALINPPGITVLALYPVTTFDFRITRSGCNNRGNDCVKPECNERQKHLEPTEFFNFAHPVFTAIRALKLANKHFIHIGPIPPVTLGG